jgi:hypothetical protein
MSHEVEFRIPATTVQVGGRDIVFKAYDEEHLIGTLMISRGGVEWRSAKHQYVVSASWSRFDDIATLRFPRERKKPTARTRKKRQHTRRAR